MLNLRTIITFSLATALCIITPYTYAISDEVLIKYDSPALTKGRALWISNCKGCHAYGTAGAPIPMNSEEWELRVIKPKVTLYDHAINGFFGEDDTMMPERGGNPNLTDSQVKLAVDYMVSLATYYIDAKH